VAPSPGLAACTSPSSRRLPAFITLHTHSHLPVHVLPVLALPVAAPAPAPPPRAFDSDAVHLSGAFILQVGFGTRCGIWPLPLTHASFGRYVLPMLPSWQPRRPMLSAPAISEEPPLILSHALGTMPSSPACGTVSWPCCLHLAILTTVACVYHATHAFTSSRSRLAGSCSSCGRPRPCPAAESV